MEELASATVTGADAVASDQAELISVTGNGQKDKTTYNSGGGGGPGGFRAQGPLIS